MGQILEALEAEIAALREKLAAAEKRSDEARRELADEREYGKALSESLQATQRDLDAAHALNDSYRVQVESLRRDVEVYRAALRARSPQEPSGGEERDLLERVLIQEAHDATDWSKAYGDLERDYAALEASRDKWKALATEVDSYHGAGAAGRSVVRLRVDGGSEGWLARRTALEAEEAGDE